MGVYIKGMEMPVFEHQSWDIRKGADGKWYVVDTNAETSDGAWHEIIPVSPHGRLIDADALKESFYRTFDVIFGTEFNNLVKGLLFSAHILGNAPIVIPKDKDGESDA